MKRDGGIKSRLGRCYELSARFVVDHRDATLVHGSIEGMGHPRNPHAWVLLPSGDIFDPVLDSEMSADAWAAFASPRVERTFTRDELVPLLVEFGHWGPWPASEETS
jgi:hypothetical protein